MWTRIKAGNMSKLQVGTYVLTLDFESLKFNGIDSHVCFENKDKEQAWCLPKEEVISIKTVDFEKYCDKGDRIEIPWPKIY